MGLLDFLKKKPKNEKTDDLDAKPGSKSASKKNEADDSDNEISREICALCNGQGAEKKWAGQWWHKKCFRAARKSAKGMI